MRKKKKEKKKPRRDAKRGRRLFVEFEGKMEDKNETVLKN